MSADVYVCQTCREEILRDPNDVPPSPDARGFFGGGTHVAHIHANPQHVLLAAAYAPPALREACS